MRTAKNLFSPKGLKAVLLHLSIVIWFMPTVYGALLSKVFTNVFILKQKSAYNAHTEPLLKNLNILPLYKPIEYFKLQFF